MRVIVPYLPGLLHPRTVPSIQRQGYEPELIACVNEVGHPDSYPAILRRLLLGDEDFCIIEHDNESRPGFLDALADCPEPWCFFAYDVRTTWEEATMQGTPTSAPLGVDFAPLGHTRFRSGFGSLIRETLDTDWFQSTWTARDTFISGAYNALGYQAHRHVGKALHHHPYLRG